MTPPEHDRLDNAPESIRQAVRQLSFAYRSGETALSEAREVISNEGGSETSPLPGPRAGMAEALRRAEAILFAAGEPLSAQAVGEVLPHGFEAGEVLMALSGHYRGRGVELVEVAGKWRFQTAQDLDFLFVETRHEQKKLSQAALETLAIIAYGQPVTRAEIEAVRGVAVSRGTIDTLMEAGWVRVKGRRKTPGRPATFGTTDAFLEHFGLEGLSVLPGKADLEAEGLLSDVLPETLGLPGEDAPDDDDPSEAFTADPAEEDSEFVTDFVSVETAAE